MVLILLFALRSPFTAQQLRQYLTQHPRDLSASLALESILVRDGRLSEAMKLQQHVVTQFPCVGQFVPRPAEPWRAWVLTLIQYSSDETRFEDSTTPSKPFGLKREPFIVEIEEPADVPLQVVLVDDAGVEHELPAGSTRERGKNVVVTFTVDSVGGVPIAETKDCRLDVVVQRANDSVTLSAVLE